MTEEGALLEVGGARPGPEVLTSRHRIPGGGSEKGCSGGGSGLAVGRTHCAHVAQQVRHVISHVETRGRAGQDLLGAVAMTALDTVGEQLT